MRGLKPYIGYGRLPNSWSLSVEGTPQGGGVEGLRRVEAVYPGCGLAFDTFFLHLAHGMAYVKLPTDTPCLGFRV